MVVKEGPNERKESVAMIAKTFSNFIRIGAAGILLFSLGCVTAGKSAPLSSAASTSTSTPGAKPGVPAKLFGQKDVQPQGNSILHYIDSRLYNLREADDRSLEALRRSVESDAGSSYLHAELGRTLAEQSQFEQATLEAEKALEISPNAPQNHLLRGKLYSIRHMSPEAVSSYEACIKLDAKMEECYTMLAREELLQKQPEAALKTIGRLLKQDADSAAALQYQGTIYSNYLKDPKKAAASFLKIIEDDPEDVRSLAALAQIYLDDKNYQNALKYLLMIERLAPTDMPMKLRVGLLYYELKDYEKAIDRFTKALALSPDNDRVAYYLGLLEAQRKNYDKALLYFESVPSSSELYKEAIVRAVLVLREENEIPKAIAFAERSLKARPDLPEIYEVLGTLLGKQGKYDEAVRVIDRGLKKFPNQEKLMFTKGVLLDKAGQFEKSMGEMRDLLAVNPENTSALNYLGYSYADRGIRLPEALELLTKANQLKPDDGYITDSLAWAYFKVGNRTKALELLKHANTLSPEEPVILEHLGDVYLDLGEVDKAKSFFQAAVAAAVKQDSPAPADLEDMKRIQDKLGKLNP